ncbi:hypothetical protein V9T40_005029 [Parthenolecanium corni]|uniref:Uncharacterized protein n=1 Tax=Parthenolecanium corni TaxID=536013 RepID=A0AAN9TF04_9HEMI
MRTKQRGNKDSHRSKKQKDDLGILNNHIPVTGIAGFNTSVMSDKLCRCNDERSYTSYTWMCCVPTNEDASLPALVLNHKMLIAVKREDAERLCTCDHRWIRWRREKKKMRKATSNIYTAPRPTAAPRTESAGIGLRERDKSSICRPWTCKRSTVKMAAGRFVAAHLYVHF